MVFLMIVVAAGLTLMCIALILALGFDVVIMGQRDDLGTMNIWVAFVFVGLDAMVIYAFATMIKGFGVRFGRKK